MPLGQPLLIAVLERSNRARWRRSLQVLLVITIATAMDRGRRMATLAVTLLLPHTSTTCGQSREGGLVTSQSERRSRFLGRAAVAYVQASPKGVVETKIVDGPIRTGQLRLVDEWVTTIGLPRAEYGTEQKPR
jgi:hypothetical protein